jgi:hypothetical protein
MEGNIQMLAKHSKTKHSHTSSGTIDGVVNKTLHQACKSQLNAGNTHTNAAHQFTARHASLTHSPCAAKTARSE